MPDQVAAVFDDLWNSIDLMIERASAKIATRQAQNVQDTFDMRGARGGNPPWVVRSNPTPLIRTGLLRRSNKGESYPDIFGWVSRVSNPTPYGAKHQDGTHGMIQREFAFWAEEDVDQAIDILTTEPIS